jgi:drug/metabolite transporter (DMT)-like permease
VSWPALAAVILWGFSFIATKTVIRELHPFTLLVLRFGIGALFLFSVQVYRDRGFLKAIRFRDWMSIFALAAVGVVAVTGLQAYGLLYTTAINTGWIIAINPILITIAARFFLGESITLGKISGIVLGFFGIFLIISKGHFSIGVFGSVSSLGDLLAFGSAIAWTIYTICGRRFLSRFSPLCSVTAITMVGWGIMFPLSLVLGGWAPVLHLSGEAWAGIVFLGIFCSGLGYLFWYAALEKKDSILVGMYLYIEPFATLTAAILVLGEEVKWITLAGGGLTLAGVYLATSGISRRETYKKNLDKACDP